MTLSMIIAARFFGSSVGLAFTNTSWYGERSASSFGSTSLPIATRTTYGPIRYLSITCWFIEICCTTKKHTLKILKKFKHWKRKRKQTSHRCFSGSSVFTSALFTANLIISVLHFQQISMELAHEKAFSGMATIIEWIICRLWPNKYKMVF